MQVATLFNDVSIAFGVAFLVSLMWVVFCSRDTRDAHDLANDTDAPGSPRAKRW